MTTNHLESDIASRNANCLQTLMEYEHASLIHRLIEKCNKTPKEAEELFADTKRFLFLCADSKVRMSPPPAIDDCWHHFILFTKDYAEFCEIYLGGFLHHRPRYIDDPVDDGSGIQNTMATAEIHFSQLSINWRYPATMASDCDKCAGCQAD